MMAVKKKVAKKPVSEKKVVTKTKENKKMTRIEYVDTITEMCERLNESGLLDELNTIELEDDLTAEQLTDLFCDAIEYVDSQEKSGDLDEDIVSFYENEPWKELPDEDEEPELEEDGTEKEGECECVCKTEDELEPEDDPVYEEEGPEPEVVTKTKVKQKPKKKIVEKIAKGKKAVAKKKKAVVEKPKKKVVEKKSVTKKQVTKTKPVADKKANTVDKSKTKDKKVAKQSSAEKDEFGFKVGSKLSMFAIAVKEKPMTMQEIKGQKWNTTFAGFYDTFAKLNERGLMDRTEDGVMYVPGSKAAKEVGKK